MTWQKVIEGLEGGGGNMHRGGSAECTHASSQMGLSWHISDTSECGQHISSKVAACMMPDAHGRWDGAGPLKISGTWTGGGKTQTIGKAAPQPGHPKFPGTGRQQWSWDAQQSKGSTWHVQCQLCVGGKEGGAKPLSKRK
jgi:hypothetical protein